MDEFAKRICVLFKIAVSQSHEHKSSILQFGLELEKKRADIRKQVEAASLSLRVNLSVIELDDKANKTRGHETAGLAEGNHQGEGPSPGKECLDFGARLHRFQGNEADEIRASREMETFEPQPV
jgi:hypothetical protein